MLRDRFPALRVLQGRKLVLLLFYACRPWPIDLERESSLFDYDGLFPEVYNGYKAIKILDGYPQEIEPEGNDDEDEEDYSFVNGSVKMSVNNYTLGFPRHRVAKDAEEDNVMGVVCRYSDADKFVKKQLKAAIAFHRRGQQN